MKYKLANRVVFASFLVLILPSLTLAASPSQADRVKIRISYSDLNIHSEAGARVLYSRVERASDKACGVASLYELGSAKRVADAKACSDYLVEKAVNQFDSDALKKVHAG